MSGSQAAYMSPDKAVARFGLMVGGGDARLTKRKVGPMIAPRRPTLIQSKNYEERE